MSGRGPWLMDFNRFASKIKSASTSHLVCKSNPTRQCPNCNHIIDNSDVVDEWPGLPRGVKFDPSDQEIISHLLEKSGYNGLTPHPFIEEFIPTVNQDDGICYTHPKNLPGVKNDGTVSHFFHRAIKAYSTGTRKRRKIHDDDYGDVRWHKTGRTKPVVLEGVQRGCKKIMVLYGGKSAKTNWVMHQYHLGVEEDENEGDYVVSKIFYQQPQNHQVAKVVEEEEEEVVFAASTTPRADPVTPKLFTPEPRQASHFVNDDVTIEVYNTAPDAFPAEEDEVQGNQERPDLEHEMYMEDEVQGNQERHEPEEGNEMIDEEKENQTQEYQNLQDSQYDVLNSQQLVEALSLCDDFLQDSEDNNNNTSNEQACFADYAHLGTKDFKRDLEECQKLDLAEPTSLSNIDLDSAPEFRLSQLDFGSQESFLAWGTGKITDSLNNHSHEI